MAFPILRGKLCHIRHSHHLHTSEIPLKWRAGIGVRVLLYIMQIINSEDTAIKTFPCMYLDVRVAFFFRETVPKRIFSIMSSW